jgi:cellulose synthase/poly-beta-1,6-N-acetylglucosamine synthase-like glycosyltransferase
MNKLYACSTLSVVIIGRNEGDRLRKCLVSVNAMHCGDYKIEILYVDSGSTDRSIEIAAAMGARVIALSAERPTAAMGRNAGWREAAGELVLFLDGDTVVDPRFATAAMHEFAEPRVAVVWGHRREIDPEASLFNRALDLDWIYAPGWTAFCGGDAMFRKSLLEKLGGFDETLIAGEEPELCNRIISVGYRILHIDRIMTGHDLAMTRFSEYWKRANRAGHAFAEVSARFNNTPHPLWRAEARRNRIHAYALAVVALTGLCTSLLMRSYWGIAAVGLVGVALALRTAWNARWKSDNWFTLLVYGVHSHFQQLPIFVGQMMFARSQRRGKRIGIVEYKRS